MRSMLHCPRCQSTDVEVISYLNIKAIRCKSCGYDQRDEYEYFPEQRSSQKAKGSFTPYKAGGSRRVQK